LSEERGQEVTIISINKLPSATPGRLGKFDYVITYRLPTGELRIVQIPAEEFEGLSDEEKEEKIREAIKRDIQELLKWAGKKIKL